MTGSSTCPQRNTWRITELVSEQYYEDAPTFKAHVLHNHTHYINPLYTVNAHSSKPSQLRSSSVMVVGTPCIVTDVLHTYSPFSLEHHKVRPQPCSCNRSVTFHTIQDLHRDVRDELSIHIILSNQLQNHSLTHNKITTDLLRILRVSYRGTVG